MEDLMGGKTVKVKCSFCSKEIECPEDMLDVEKHACFECFQNKSKELSKMPPEKIHVDIPRDRMEDLIPETLTNHIVEEVFPDVWSERKEELKDLSKKELAEEMFGAGAFIAIQGVLKTIKEGEENEINLGEETKKKKEDQGVRKQKLVRDNVPEIHGLQKRHVADDEEYVKELVHKLQEEVDEFKEKHEVEELADIVEVVHAISEFRGTPVEKLEAIRKEKAEKRGGFRKRLIWEQD